MLNDPLVWCAYVRIGSVTNFLRPSRRNNFMTLCELDFRHSKLILKLHSTKHSLFQILFSPQWIPIQNHKHYQQMVADIRSLLILVPQRAI